MAIMALGNTDDIYEYSCILTIGISPPKLHISPRGGGRVLQYKLYVPLWRVWFSSRLLWDRVYKSESLVLKSGIIFQDIDELFKPL